jgi:DNA polymerase
MANDDVREELRQVAASLRAYLELQLDSGATGIPRKPKAKTADAPARARSPVPAQAEAQAHAPVPAPVPATARTQAAAAEHEPAVEPAPASLPPSVPAYAPSTPPPSIPAPRALEVIREEVRACTKCSLAESRTNTVFSRGNPEAQLVFIGEAPGADEDAQGLPFVGRAGQLLDRMIVAMGLDPANDVYVCNIIKCRPPGNRRPEPSEIEACIPYLHEQLARISPRVIVALGNTAVGALLGTTLGITKVRGSWKLYRGKVPVMPTYHPSYLIRPSAQQAEAKRQAWDDLKAVMKELGLSRRRGG